MDWIQIGFLLLCLDNGQEYREHEMISRRSVITGIDDEQDNAGKDISSEVSESIFDDSSDEDYQLPDTKYQSSTNNR